jgi:hypothetical protein
VDLLRLDAADPDLTFMMPIQIRIRINILPQVFTYFQYFGQHTEISREKD